MIRSSATLILIGAVLCLGAEDDLVFRSDVSLVRVDAQVVDRNNRAITGLEKEDFVLLYNGKQQEIRSFEREEMPVDVLVLLDVSGSMRPHVERIANAAGRALSVLAEGDRVAIMVFDRSTRMRLPFTHNRHEIENGLEGVVRHESFNGGTDITRALLDAGSWVQRNARKEARRAIVILTDDETEFNRDDRAVGNSLAAADAVLMAILAPDAMGTSQGGLGTPRRGGGYPSGGGWPGSGGGWPGSGGGWGGGWPGMGGPRIGIGRRGPMGGGYPGGGYPGGGGGGPVILGGRTRSAGTADIARASGGDSARVEDASAFEDTLTRIRQRYALHFNLPEGSSTAQDRNVEVGLTATAQRRYSAAEVRYRRMNQFGVTTSDPAVVSSTSGTATRDEETESAQPEFSERQDRPRGGWRRVDDPNSDRPVGPRVAVAQPQTTDEDDNAPSAPPVAAPPPAEQEQPARGGWRRVKPGEVP